MNVAIYNYFEVINTYRIIEKLLEEKETIKKSFYGMTLSDIYEEKQIELQRLDEINEEIQNEKYETHSV